MTSEVSNNAIAAAADSVDKMSVSTATSTDDGKKDPKTVKGMLAAMHKHSDGTNVMKESIKTFSNPFGSDKKNDIFVATKAEGIAKMKEMMDADRQKQKKDSKKCKRWDFRASPHEQFGKTLEDTYAAFVQWAKKEDEKGESSADVEVAFNVSKAYRRIESYADWMEDNAEELVDTPLTADSIKEAWKAWDMKSSIDKNENFVWWLDFKQLDRDSIKNKVPLKDSFRYMVWYAHFIMFNENAQNNGMVFIEAVGHVGFIESMTLVPMKLGVKLDRLTIGILPIKMKALYVLQSPTWMSMMSKFMSLFMSKKMKERIHVLEDFSEIESMVGNESVPAKFGELEGGMAADLIEAKYYS
ncbi:MAG: hypothetical protein SGBAC_005603 [Bacillariaceae sp.]